MEIHFKKILLLSFLLTWNFHFLNISSNYPFPLVNEEELYETNLSISTATIYFTLLAEGRYTCTFDLLIIGNEYSSNGEIMGNVSFPDSSISTPYLYFPDYPDDKIYLLNDSLFYKNDTQYCLFQSDLELPIGEKTKLRGSYVGNCQSYTSGLYTYRLGIDWGAWIDQQSTTIFLDASIIDLVEYNVPESQLGNPEKDNDGNIVGYEWASMACSGFNGTFWVYPKTENPNLLEISKIDWNVSINQRIELQIQNLGSFNLNIEINTPTWIDCNVTGNFWLMINETRGILFLINSQVTSGLGDTILIKIIGSHDIYPIDVIEIPVTVGANIQFFDIFFFLFSLSIIIAVIPILLYYQRLNIKQFINQIKKQVPPQYMGASDPIKTTLSYNGINESRVLSWSSIKNRWESILPKNELKVLELLYNFGNMNQQTLANHLGVSKVTMSRLISRLESKRLIQRERLGMSKIIQLNEEIL